MTTFAELEALVVSQTRRPEVPAVTKAAIRAAVLRAHHVDFFPRDLAMGSLSYEPLSSAQFYDFPAVSETLVRFRAFQQLQSIDPNTAQPAENLEYRELQDLHDSDSVRRQHIYTLIGDTLRVYPTAATGKLACYYYANPALAEATLASWIVNTYPDEVAMWAAGIVWARTGFAEMAADTQKNHINPFKELLLSSHLLVTAN